MWDRAGPELRSSQPWLQNPVPLAASLTKRKKKKMLRLCVSWVGLSYSNHEGCLLKGGCLLHRLAKTRPNQSAPSWTPVLNFQDFFSHYNTKNHAQGWRFNILMRHVMLEEVWLLSAQVLINPHIYMLRHQPHFL